jgi:hypothetical protein
MRAEGIKVGEGSKAQDTSCTRKERGAWGASFSVLSPRPSALIYLVASAFVLLGGCTSGTPVSIANHSSNAIEKVMVSGPGFSVSGGTIGVGNTETLRVRPKPEATFRIKVAFEVDGQRYSSATSDSEGDPPSRIEVTVDPDLTITIDTSPP